MNDEETLIKGADAAQLLANPIFREAFDGVEEDLNNALLNVNTTDADTCLDLIRHKQVLELLKSKIVGFINDGKVARQDIEAELRENEEVDFER